MRKLLFTLLLISSAWAKPVSDPGNVFVVEVPDDWKKFNEKELQVPHSTAYISPDKRCVYILASITKKPSDPPETLNDVLKFLVVSRLAQNEMSNFSGGRLDGYPGRTFQSISPSGRRLGAVIAQREQTFALVMLITQHTVPVGDYMKQQEASVRTFKWSAPPTP